MNSYVCDHIQSASYTASSRKGGRKLAQRNKLIRIADSSEDSRQVVNEYERRDLADDSDDDKRLRCAGSIASQKRQCTSSRKG